MCQQAVFGQNTQKVGYCAKIAHEQIFLYRNTHASFAICAAKTAVARH